MYGTSEKPEIRAQCPCLDVRGGFGAGSEFTWNLVGLLGYDFHIGSAASRAFLGGRALYQDVDSGSFEWDVTQYGPLPGLGFYF
jgi:hypothetical protein